VDFRFFEPWHGFLPRAGGHVVACAGAGGKSALLAACGEVLRAEGVPWIAVPWPSAGADRLNLDEPGRVILVEADAVSDRPVALPDATHPVWPTRTSLALLVLGVEAVGSRAGEVVAGFDPGSPFLAGLAEQSILEWEHLARILLDEGGYLDRVPAGVPAALVLTGLAEQPDSVGLFDFVGRAMADPRLPIVLFGDPTAAPPVLRAVCRAEEGEPGAG